MKTENQTTHAILGIAIIASITLLFPDPVMATTPTAADTGFGEVAWEIYDELDNALGLVIGLIGGGIALASMVRGINVPMVATGAGIAVGSQVAPDVLVTLNGGWLLPISGDLFLFSINTAQDLSVNSDGLSTSLEVMQRPQG
jgi:hypothetical protein